jgi:hypothetical protein
MLTKRERTGDTWIGLLILALGVAIGALARPERWFDPAPPPRAPFPALEPKSPSEAPPANELATIELRIPESSAAVLERVRKAALERGIITQAEADTVPAELVLEGVAQPAEIRIKGDWTDHVEDERWSYRIRLTAGTFRGMREFSIQAPKTRGYLWEWLVHEAARRERVLVPRSTFLNVVQNGHALGVYFLEEHFEKELLESQGRREGPIVVWDESALWSALLQDGEIPAKGLRGSSRGTAATHTPAPAEVRAFGEGHLAASPTLSRALHAALDELKALRALALAELPEVDRRRVLESIDELRGRTLEDLVDVERLGCAHALLSLFQSEHALAWHNMRFYRDPVQARLEPILFDCAVQEPAGTDPVPWRATGLAAAFARSPAYLEATFTHLGRFLRSDWLDGFFADVEPELARFEAALAAEGLPPGCSVGEMKQRLRAQVVRLRRTCLPADALQLEARYALSESGDARGGTLEVHAWATTRAPVRVEGFRFSNGSVVRAAGALAEAPAGTRLAPEGVVLPADGTALTFRFAMNERLASLESVEKVTRALREQIVAPEALDLDVRALYRLVAGEEAREELLEFRRVPPAQPAEGRPSAPSLAEALERHPFLRHEPALGRLVALRGTWDVVGDLVLPAGVALTLVPGTTLRFAEGALVLADAPLAFEGTPAEPIVLEPAEGAASFCGVIVLGARGRSTWSDVVVRRTDAAARGGWIQTGAVTFYRSPVTLVRCHFEGTKAEDALNVFGADVLLDGVTFSGARSDCFDGDFVTGEVRATTFRDGEADGLDVSGSDVRVLDCRFVNLGDKACSIGEKSRARVQGGSAVNVGLGVAAKDASEVEVEGLAIEARHYALAAFVKKPEYGPARLVARNLAHASGGLGTAIAATGCVLELDGARVEPQAIDVEASYQEGVLGRAK